MVKRRVISLFICMGLLFSGCAPEDSGQKRTDTELVSMNPSPDLSYEVPVSVPHILVDQVGYPSFGEKTAIFTGSTLPETFEVIAAESGEVVFGGKIKEREQENAAGEQVAAAESAQDAEAPEDSATAETVKSPLDPMVSKENW